MQEGVGGWCSAVRLIPELYSHCDKVSLRLFPNFLPREVLPFPITQVAHLQFFSNLFPAVNNFALLKHQ